MLQLAELRGEINTGDPQYHLQVINNMESKPNNKLKHYAAVCAITE